MPENAIAIAPSSAALRGKRPSRSSGPVPSLRGSRLRPLLGDTDEPQAELLVLARLGRRWRLEHRVRARLGLGEGHDLADVRLAREDHRPAVDAQRDPAVRRRAVVEGVEHGPELLVHAFHGLALEAERTLEQIASVDPDRSAA